MIKKIVLTILLLTSFASGIYSQPFPKKKYWYGFGFIYSDPQKEVKFGKYHKLGYEGNIYFRTVLKENLEFGVAAEFGLYEFDVQKFRKERSIQDPEPGQPYLLDYDKKKGTMLSIYQDIYMNALPKFSKDFFFSAGLGFYRLVNKEMTWRLNPFGDQWMEWNTDEEEVINSFGFNFGMNYDYRVYKNTRLAFEVRFHQLILTQDMQQFLKFKVGFLF